MEGIGGAQLLWGGMFIGPIELLLTLFPMLLRGGMLLGMLPGGMWLGIPPDGMLFGMLPGGILLGTAPWGVLLILFIMPAGAMFPGRMPPGGMLVDTPPGCMLPGIPPGGMLPGCLLYTSDAADD